MPAKFFFFKGRIALYAILKTMGIKPADQVLLPGFTCVVVPNAVKYVGAEPVYVDIDPTTYNIDPQKIKEKITEKTKAIIAQHTFGIPAEMDGIIDVAKKYNLYVIEDSCHAVGARYKGREVGTFGDAAFFSAQWSKPVTTGLGGWATVNNSALREKMRNILPEFRTPSSKEKFLLRLQYFAYSMVSKPSLFWFARDTYRTLSKLGIAIGSSSKDELECRMPDGYEKRMSAWQQDLLERKLAEIDEMIGRRRYLTSLCESLLSKRGMRTVEMKKAYEPVFLRYPLLVKNKRKVLDEARIRRLELGDWFLSPVHPNFDGWNKANYQKGTCPIAEKVCEHIINLPMHSQVRKSDIERTVEFIAGDVRQWSSLLERNHYET